MIIPTVGRIVHVFRNGDGPLAGIIAHVGESGLVNLCVFLENGTPMAFEDVPLLQPEDEHPSEPLSIHCEWMPYQVKKSFGSESGEKGAGTETITPEYTEPKGQ